MRDSLPALEGGKSTDPWALPRLATAPAAVLFLVSTVLGAVSMGSSLLMLGLALKSPQEGSAFRSMGLPGMDYGQIVTAICERSPLLPAFCCSEACGPAWLAQPRPALPLPPPAH